MNSIRTIWLHFLVSILFLTTGCTTSGQEVEQAREVEHFSTERIEQLVAPIALYPDALLAQILMAATYPFEVIQAARWIQQYPELTGEALQDALKKERWDPSVKSLAAFPSVLKRMETELTWMEDLGNAFLGQQREVMNAVQRLRVRAREAGHLESTPQQSVVLTDRVVVIKPTQPDVIYVPSYNPTLVFGDWNYPTIYYPNLYAAELPPPFYRPPLSQAGLLTFGFGTVAGGFLFSQFDWGTRHIIVDPYFLNRAPAPVNISTPINISTPVNVSTQVNVSTPWRHDPSHRHNVRYRDPALEQHWGVNSTPTTESPISSPPTIGRRYPTIPGEGRGRMNGNLHSDPNPTMGDRPPTISSPSQTLQGPSGLPPYQRSHRPTIPTMERPANTTPSTILNSDRENSGNLPSSQIPQSQSLPPYQRSHRPTVPAVERPVSTTPSTTLNPENTDRGNSGNLPSSSQIPQGQGSSDLLPYQQSHRPAVPTMERPANTTPSTILNSDRENSGNLPSSQIPQSQSLPPYQRSHRPTVPAMERPVSTTPSTTLNPENTDRGNSGNLPSSSQIPQGQGSSDLPLYQRSHRPTVPTMERPVSTAPTVRSPENTDRRNNENLPPPQGQSPSVFQPFQRSNRPMVERPMRTDPMPAVQIRDESAFSRRANASTQNSSPSREDHSTVKHPSVMPAQTNRNSERTDAVSPFRPTQERPQPTLRHAPARSSGLGRDKGATPSE